MRPDVEIRVFEECPSHSCWQAGFVLNAGQGFVPFEWQAFAWRTFPLGYSSYISGVRSF